MLKIFKYNHLVCKKTDDFGKTVVNSIISSKKGSNIEPNLFTINSELYCGKITEPYRCTKCKLDSGAIISNEINDEMLRYVCKSKEPLNLHNIEINECGIGGHHQLKSTTSMMMLLLKMAEYVSTEENIIISTGGGIITNEENQCI